MLLFVRRWFRLSSHRDTPYLSPDPSPSGFGVLIAVLCFALVFPVVNQWAGSDVDATTATLAAVPGILIAALQRK